MDNINPGVKKCEFCKEEISITLRRCPFCGSLLQKVNQVYYSPVKSGNNFMSSSENTINNGSKQFDNNFSNNSSTQNNLNNNDKIDYSEKSNNYTENYGIQDNELQDKSNDQNGDSDRASAIGNNSSGISLEKSREPHEGNYNENLINNPERANADIRLNNDIKQVSASDFSNQKSFQQPGLYQGNNMRGENGSDNSYLNKLNNSDERYREHIRNQTYSMDVKPLSNKMKVLLTTVSAFVPWLGQLIGLIAAIVFMNYEDDEDRKSFGRALLVSSLIVFLITSCLILFVVMALSSISQ
ncbi:MAG: hypothetical protein Q8942_13745 [Bacillota bacterium]|nr:hypothetical protein [Bacillota bacterium]